jgi:folate-binding protein YgfZ
MTSQELRLLAPGVSTESLLLDPQGHIEYVLRIVDDGETAWILVDENLSTDLFAFLNRMRFTLRVEVSDVSTTHQAVGFFTGGIAEAELRSLQADQPPLVIWVDPWSSVCVGGWQYATASEHPATDWRYAEAIVLRGDVPKLAGRVAAATISAAGLLALDALRIAAWRPSQHSEVDDRALPHEFDWMRSAVHLEKGCYRGQETVAKVHNLGHPPRRLVMLHLDGSDAVLPNRGDLLYRAGDEKPVGRITSSARHMEWGSIALALLKRSVDSDVQLEVECESLRIPATQEMIVPPDAGATRNVPKIPRL